MTSVNTLCKKLLNVNHTVIESCTPYPDCDGVQHLRIKARPNAWRALDFGGDIVEIECPTHRVVCPEHGLAEYVPRSAVAKYMRIDWQTVINCVSRDLEDLEPERAKRLDGLVHIGIDETSYRKGHKYITVIVKHDTNTVVWVSDGHGKSVFFTHNDA